MCFSVQADLIGGLVVTGIGIDVALHVRHRRDHIALAALPLLFGAHQLTEAFVWWGLQGHVSKGIGDVATWIYLVFAFVVLPVYVPLAVRALEPPGRRRQAMDVFVVIGMVVSVFLLVGMIRGPVRAQLGMNHLSYHTGLSAGVAIVVGYIVATCGTLLCSGFRYIAMFGVVNVIAVGVLARLTIGGFASLWCFWAAITSAAFAVYLRYAQRPHSNKSVPTQGVRAAG